MSSRERTAHLQRPSARASFGLLAVVVFAAGTLTTHYALKISSVDHYRPIHEDW